MSDLRTELVELLLTNPMFEGLGRMDVEILATAGAYREINPGERLFHAGDVSDGFYVLLEGSISIVADRGSVILGTIKPGESIGELGLAADTRTATALATSNATVWQLSRRGLEVLLESGDPIAISVLSGLSRAVCSRYRAAVHENDVLVDELTRTEEGLALISTLDLELVESIDMDIR